MASKPSSTTTGLAKVATLDECLDQLMDTGYVVIPREVTGFSEHEAAAVHGAQLSELDRRFKGWREANAPVHTEMQKALQGLFSRQRNYPGPLLETHA